MSRISSAPPLPAPRYSIVRNVLASAWKRLRWRSGCGQDAGGCSMLTARRSRKPVGRKCRVGAVAHVADFAQRNKLSLAQRIFNGTFPVGQNFQQCAWTQCWIGSHSELDSEAPDKYYSKSPFSLVTQYISAEMTLRNVQLARQVWELVEKMLNHFICKKKPCSGWTVGDSDLHAVATGDVQHLLPFSK